MIDILLATFNGEKYLDTQISSIVNQSYQDWVLYIHDDGSSDNTIILIQKWCNLDKRIIFVDDGIVFHNSGDNFMHLLKKSTSEYICFSDQDDYWFDYKLEKMINAFPKTTSPHLLCTNCYLWDMQSGVTLQHSFFQPQHLKNILFNNGGLQGCAMMFNAELRNLVNTALTNDNMRFNMHDFIISLAALTFGKVTYLSDGLFLYRYHSSTVTIHPAKNRKEYFFNAIKHKKSPIVTQATIEDINSFHQLFSNRINRKESLTIKKFVSFIKMKPIRRFISILFSNFSLRNSHLKLMIKILFRPYYSA